MCNVICVTNRGLCRGDFLRRLEVIAAQRPRAIILREKDLTAADYERLARSVMEICNANQVPLILHNFVDVAIKLDATAIHLPFAALKNFEPAQIKIFKTIGVSCHSLREAKLAESFGCSYIIAGHIFATDCKKDLEPRGLTFLSEIVGGVKIPVWAIGGINAENFSLVKTTGAAGICLMSSLMHCENVAAYLKKFV